MQGQQKIKRLKYLDWNECGYDTCQKIYGDFIEHM